MEVAVMCGVAAVDVQTTTGSNMDLLRWETGLDTLSTSLGKVKLALGKRLAVVPDSDTWRVMYLGKLLEARGEASYEGYETDHLTGLIDSLCSN